MGGASRQQRHHASRLTMAGWTLPEMSPWKRRPLVVPPNSRSAWILLVTWEAWMGIVIYGVVGVGARFVGDLARRQPRTVLSVVFAIWSGAILFVIAMWLIWELWNAAAPKPITDEFLRLLDASFGADWRSLRRWPWARLTWAYGFATVGVLVAFWLDHLRGQMTH